MRDTLLDPEVDIEGAAAPSGWRYQRAEEFGRVEFPSFSTVLQRNGLDEMAKMMMRMAASNGPLTRGKMLN